MYKKTKKICTRFKPLSNLHYSIAPTNPSCSNCAFFSSHNCHSSASDDIEYDDFM